MITVMSVSSAIVSDDTGDESTLIQVMAYIH